MRSIVFVTTICMATLVFSAIIVMMLRYRSAWHAAVREQERLRAKLVDWPELRFYEKANTAAGAEKDRPRVVFIGDSITQRWNVAEDFPQLEALNRGIGWQTTAEMMARFRADVIALRPRAVIILGGSNDFHAIAGPMLLRSTQNNVESMVELARLHGIVPFVGTIPPVSCEHLSSDEQQKIAFKLRSSYNEWVRGNCVETCNLIDFERAFQESEQPLSALLPDGSHPNELGYAKMTSATIVALERATVVRIR